MDLDIGPYGNKSSISVAVVQSVMTGFPIDQRERHHNWIKSWPHIAVGKSNWSKTHSGKKSFPSYPSQTMLGSFSHHSDADVSDSSLHFCWRKFTINALISCTQTVPKLASCFRTLSHHHHRHHHDHHDRHDDHDHQDDHHDHDHHCLHHLFNIIRHHFFKRKQVYIDPMPRIVVRDLLARRSDLRPLKFEVGMGQDWIVCVPCMPCIFNYCMS